MDIKPELSRTTLLINLGLAKNQLYRHQEEEKLLLETVIELEEQIEALGPISSKDRFQAVFDEENFHDAVWFLQDEPEIKEFVKAYFNSVKWIKDKLEAMGVKLVQ